MSKKIEMIAGLIVLSLMVCGTITAQEAMVVDESGNVGINIQAPTERLDVDGNIQTTGNITATGTVSSPNIQVLEDSGIGVFTGMVLIEDTMVTLAARNKTIDLPPEYIVDNTIILSSQMRYGGGKGWVTLPYRNPNYFLSVEINDAGQVLIINYW